MIVTGTDGGLARLFTYQNGHLKVKQNHSSHKESSSEKCKINAISWINLETIVTGDDQGNLVIWDINAKQTKVMTFSKNSIFVIKAHPDREDTIAFGTRYGYCFVVNVSGKGRLLHKIRAHDQDIQGLDWCPETPEIFKEETKDENENENLENLFLAVSSRMKTISIWRLKDASQVALLKVPSHRSQKDESPWITLNWFDSNTILTSGAQGELGQWKLDKLTKNDKHMIKSDGSGEEFSNVHVEHYRHIFSIASYENFAVSVGYDRSLVCYNIVKDRLEFNLPTFSTRITCLASNPIDPSIIALGSGDGLIRIWKSGSNKSMFECLSVILKGRCEILALTWHPLRENMLAFATDEGRIGITDALSPRTSPTIFDFKHRSSVYNLIFGPTLKKSEEEKSLSLYSLGDNSIFMHHPHGKEKSINIESIIAETNGFDRKAPNRSEVVFQPILEKYLVAGCDDGTVEVFAMPDLKLVCTLKSFQKLIQSIAWQTYDSQRQEDLLAVASNEYDIHLWTLSPKLKDEVNVYTKPDHVLTGHKLRVIQVVWNPIDHAKLLSVSYDGTAQVWNTSNCQGEANFRGHSSRVFCGMWMPNDPDLIMTGGDDCTMMAWRPSEQPGKEPIKKNTKIKGLLEAKATLVKDFGEEIKELQELQAKQSFDRDSTLSLEPKNPDVKGSSGKTRKLNKKVYFGLAMAQESVHREKVYDDITMLLNDEINVTKSPHLAFFSKNPKDLTTLTNLEAFNISEGSYDSSFNLMQWSNLDLKSQLEKQAGNLSDYHVNIAASLDHETWKWTCATYAKQLEEKGQCVKASSYYLIINEVAKAIQVLEEANFFQAAITIAKSRLPSDHPMIADLFRKWALNSAQDGLYEMSAKCWLAIEEYGQAAFTLSKRSDGHSLRVAAELMKKAGEEGKAKVLALQAVDAFDKSSDQQGLELLMKNLDIEDVKEKASSLLK